MCFCGTGGSLDVGGAGAGLVAIGGGGRPEEEVVVVPLGIVVEVVVESVGSVEDVDGGCSFCESLCGGPTGTMREPNSTPMVTSWCVTKRPSQSRMVSEDLPQPESPMHTSFAM